MTRLAVLVILSAWATVAVAREGVLPRIEPLAPSAPPAREQGARSDTLFLFAASGPGSYGSPGTDARGFTFDHEGGPAEAGWFGVDHTAQEGEWWHVASTSVCAGTGTDMSEALPFDAGDTVNDYALWCGRQDVCGWENGSGYGNYWSQTAVLDLNDLAPQDSLVLAFAYRSDFEGIGYDEFELRAEIDGVWETLYTNSITSDRTYREFRFTFYAEELGGSGVGTRFGFHFASDGAWSDEDGLYDSNIGALWLDNLVVEIDGALAWSADFEDGLDPARVSFEATPGAGMHSALYAPLFHEDLCIVNDSHGWAFFDLDTFNPQYPVPVIAYGPPWVDEDLESPLLEVDQFGQPLAFGDVDELRIERWVYFDLPLSPLIFTRKPAVAARTAESACLGGFRRENVLYFDDAKRWLFLDDARTEYLRESAEGGTITGLKVRIGGVRDMCPIWCNNDGDGWEHTPGPYFDNIRVYVVSGQAASWDVFADQRLQDNFPGSSGRVRLDSALDLQPAGAQTLVVGDSTVVKVDMTASGGLAESFNGDAGELRPELRLWWRVVAGPHEGQIEAAQADPDASDGIWSPWTGSGQWLGDTWGSMQADWTRRDGVLYPSSFAFDFNDAYFEPGDIVEFFYRAESLNGASSTSPVGALSHNTELERHYRVRCLPTPGERILYVEDQAGVGAAFERALSYQGCSGVDIYSTQGSSSGLNNGLGCRAVAADLSGYRVIVWDSGDLKHNTLTAQGGSQICYDVDLLQAWLDAATETSGLWIFGNSIASDLNANSSGALNIFLGARLLDDNHDYEDYTGIRQPRVFATHPSLEVGGLFPYFDVADGCPTVADIDLVVPDDALCETAHDWEEDAGTDIVAGILNLDPEGDGTEFNAMGARTSVLYNPFSFASVRRAGFDVWGQPYYDYYYVMVPLVIDRLWDPHPFGWCYGTPTEELVPAVTGLAGAHPNPFNPKTTLSFSLATPGHASLRIYDLAGRRVATLLDKRKAAGHHELDWNGRDDAGRRLASGVYFVRFESGKTREETKVILLK